jgi:hypothetical protein
MQRTIPRLASVAFCAAALSAFAAGSAQAAVLSYTATATAVSAESATLNGSIVSGGSATQWQFSYGTGPFVTTYTATGTVPANSPASVPVVSAVTGLIPATTYSFQLIGNQGIAGSTTTPLTIAYGGVLTFTTKGAGSASLAGTKLKVKKGRAMAAVKCSSTIACQGMLTIVTHHRGKRLVCGTATFSVDPGAKKTLSTGKVSRACRTLLTATSPTTTTPTPIKAFLTAVFTSYQKTISKPVTLTFVS